VSDIVIGVGRSVSTVCNVGWDDLGTGGEGGRRESDDVVTL